jgi:hypothetical protein
MPINSRDSSPKYMKQEIPGPGQCEGAAKLRVMELHVNLARHRGSRRDPSDAARLFSKQLRCADWLSKQLRCADWRQTLGRA